MKAIGLDVGDKRIGVAVSDDLLLTASGLSIIERVGIRKDADKIIDLIRQNNCNIVVMGLPRNMDGSIGFQAEKVLDFKTMLENKLSSLGFSHVSVVTVDERLTTVQAERILLEGNVSRKKRKEVIDKQAAVLILQSYLNRLYFEKGNK